MAATTTCPRRPREHPSPPRWRSAPRKSGAPTATWSARSRLRRPALPSRPVSKKHMPSSRTLRTTWQPVDDAPATGFATRSEIRTGASVVENVGWHSGATSEPRGAVRELHLGTTLQGNAGARRGAGVEEDELEGIGDKSESGVRGKTAHCWPPWRSPGRRFTTLARALRPTASPAQGKE